MVVVVNNIHMKEKNGGYTLQRIQSHAQFELLRTHMRYISNASSPFFINDAHIPLLQ